MNEARRGWGFYLAIAAVVVASAVVLTRHSKIGHQDNEATRATPRPSLRADVAGDTVVQPDELPIATSPRNSANTPEARMLSDLKSQWGELFRSHPGLEHNMHTAQKVEAAFNYAEFCSIHGVFGDRKDLLFDLLADQAMAPTRGEIGEQEQEEIRKLLGEADFQAMLAYQKIQPGIQQGDEVAAYCRKRNVELGQSEEAIRKAAATTVSADGLLIRRLATGRPIEESEYGQLRVSLTSSYEPLRKEVARGGDPAALAVVDEWIAVKISEQIELARTVSGSIRRK